MVEDLLLAAADGPPSLADYCNILPIAPVFIISIALTSSGTPERRATGIRVPCTGAGIVLPGFKNPLIF